MSKLLIMSVLLFSVIAKAEVVTLKISNMGGDKGQMAVAVFSHPDGFPDNAGQSVYTNFFPLPSGQSEATFTIDLPPSHYAVATYLDKNMNRKLDTNMLGAPKERFGFSQNPSIGFSAPNFSECAFEVETNKKQVLNIRMNKLF